MFPKYVLRQAWHFVPMKVSRFGFGCSCGISRTPQNRPTVLPGHPVLGTGQGGGDSKRGDHRPGRGASPRPGGPVGGGGVMDDGEVRAAWTKSRDERLHGMVFVGVCL